MKFAILGAGSIAEKMAGTVSKMDGVDAYAVGSRDLSKAERLVKNFGFKKAYGSYAELLSDGEIDLVYVATPHSLHFEHVNLCIEYGRNVLCEKAFMVNAQQARAVMQAAKERNLLLAEAIWTRYMPSRGIVTEIIDSGAIGKPAILSANLGYSLGHVNRMVKPELAGGALLDLGVYTLNFASMFFGDDVEKVTSSCVKSDSGVDLRNSITLTYKDGKMAVLYSDMMCVSDRQGVISGDKGHVVLKNINNIEEISLYDACYNLVKKYPVPKQITGYEYEVEACREAVYKGWTECPQMPHSEILFIMETMDAIRQSWALKYPFE
jgi:predicted dehydrogenase